MRKPQLQQLQYPDEELATHYHPTRYQVVQEQLWSCLEHPHDPTAGSRANCCRQGKVQVTFQVGRNGPRISGRTFSDMSTVSAADHVPIVELSLTFERARS